MKTKLKRTFSTFMAMLMVLGIITAAGVFNDPEKIHAATTSEAMGTDTYTTGAVGGATLTAGSTYSMGGFNWICTEYNSSTKVAIMQSKGMTGGTWPGYKLTQDYSGGTSFGGANSYYTSDITNKNIANYDSVTSSFYSTWSEACADTTKGLYLVSNSAAGQTTSGNQGSGYYWQALKDAATNYASFGASSSVSWLGTVCSTSGAWYVSSGGGVGNGGGNQSNSLVVAPAFNLDTSKVSLSGTTINLATFTPSTGISATQSTTNVVAGSTTSLSEIITGVTYVGGDNAGKSAGFTVEIPATGAGYITGTNWTAPTGITSNTNVTFTIKSAENRFSTTKTVTVMPSGTTTTTIGTTNNYSTGPAATGGELTLGATYTFGKYKDKDNVERDATWIAAEKITDGKYVMVSSTGLAKGYWPGYVANGNANRSTDYNYTDFHALTAGTDGFDPKRNLSTWYAANSGAEATGVTGHGSGLYLVPNTKVNQTTNGQQGSGNYWTALKAAAANYASFGASSGYSWLGTVYSTNGPWYVSSNGGVNGGGSDQNGSCVVAPAFNLDTSKVQISGSTISVATFEASTGISATQSTTAVTEGSTVDLSTVITGVTYTGGTNDGNAGTYTVSIPATGAGGISGTTWSVPTQITRDTSVTLTIQATSGGTATTATKTVTIQPREAGSISVTKSADFPSSVTVGDSVDLSRYITVTGTDAGGEIDGTVTSYSLEATGYGTFSGTTYTLANVSTAKDITVTVTPTGNIGDVDYSGESATFTIKVKPDTTGWVDRDELTDPQGFHEYTDSTSGIKWKFRYNDNGLINYLYTEDDVASIISDGYVLLVPSSVNGVPVIGIGGGSKDGSVIPFIPTSGEKENTTWTSIYIPASVKVINDGAFYKNKAAADIVIPGNVETIGVNAFRESKITGVTFNDATSLSLNSESFAAIPTLTSVKIRGNGVTIKQRVFSGDTGLTRIEIPNGTKFKGETDQNNSYAFEGTTGLSLIKIDTERVYSNIFSGNKSLTKVIFGENVENVQFDWSGTAATNTSTLSTTADRATYVLNADTIFEMDKSTGGSPFGYAGDLTVVGKSHTLDGWEDKYSDEGDPVIGKVAFLAANFATLSTVKNYAKGSASDINITVEDNPAENGAVTATVTASQNGIEAYYSGIIFSGKKLEKDKTTVYKMFGEIQDGTYASDEFYVIRTAKADELLGTSRATIQNEGNEYITRDTADVLAEYEAEDDITVTASDVSKGTLDVKAIVLRKDGNGDILLDNTNSNRVIAWSYPMAIPVKNYTAEQDFLENYGSYASVIGKITELEGQVTTLRGTVTEKENEIAEVERAKADLQAEYDTLSSTNTANEGTITTLRAQIAEKNAQIASLSTTVSQLRTELATYMRSYNDIVEELKTYMNSTDESGDGYTATITEGGVEKEVVYINGTPYEYTTQEGETVNIGGEDKPVLNIHADLGGGEEDIKVVVTDGGVVVLDEGVDGEGHTTYTPGETYQDTIGAIQRKAAEQLAAVRAQLSDLNNQIEAIKAALISALDIDESEFEGKTLNEQIEIIKGKINDLVTAKNNLQTQVTELTGQVAELEAEVAAAGTENDALNETIDALTKILNGQNAELTELSAKITAIQDEKDALQTRYDAMSAEEKASEEGREIAAQITALEEKETAYNSLKTQIDEVLTQVEDLKTQNASKDETIAALNEIITTLRTRLEEAQTGKEELQALYDALEDKSTEDAERLRQQLAAYDENQRTISALTDSVEELTAQVTALSGEKASLTTRLSTATANLEAAEASLVEYTGFYNQLLRAINGLVSDVPEGTTYSKTDITAALATLARVKQDLEDLNGGVGDVDARITALRATIAELSTGINALAEFVKAEEGETDAATLTNIREAVAQLLQEYSAVKLEYAEVKKALYGEGVSAADLDAKTLEEVQQRINEVSGDTEIVEAAIRKVLTDGTVTATESATLNQLLTQVQTMKTNLSANETMIASIMSALGVRDSGSILSTIAALNRQIDQLTSENTTLTASVNSKYQQGYDAGYAAGTAAAKVTNPGTTTDSETVNALKSQVTLLTTQNETLKSANTSLESTNAALTSDNNSLTIANASLVSENNTLSETNATLTSKNAELKEDKKELKSANSTLSKDKETLAGQVNQLTSQVNQLTNEKNTLTTAANNLQNEKTQLENANKSLTESNNKLQSQVSSAQTEAANARNEAARAAQNNQGTTQATAPSSETKITIGGTENKTEAAAPSESPVTPTVASTSETVKTVEKIITIEKKDLNAGTTPDPEFLKEFSNEDYTATITSHNVGEVTETTKEQRSTANTVFALYTDNPDMFAEVTDSSRILEAIGNDGEDVTLEATLSIDLEPTEEQEEKIKNGETLNVSIESTKLQDGEEYLVVHESTKRSGEIDVITVTAHGDAVDIPLPDLSPVSIAKVIIKENENFVAVPEVNEEVVNPTDFLTPPSDDSSLDTVNLEPIEEEEEHPFPWTIVIICAVVLFVVVFIVIYMMKRKKSKGIVEEDYSDETV